MREHILQSDIELESIKKWVNITNELDGDLLEVGVYMGGTSKFIAENKKQDKKIMLIDTFEGLLDVNSEDDVFLKNGDFIYTNLNETVNSFKDYNCEIFKGFFPNEKPDNFSEKKFSFVHLDVDTFSSTLNCLKEIYNQVVPNGVILIHDYKNENTPGVQKAVDIFLLEKNIKIIDIVDSQCVIIKK
jgi:hypothetical protein